MTLALPLPANTNSWAVVLKQAMYLVLRSSSQVSEADFVARVSILDISGKFAGNGDKRVVVVFDILPPTSASSVSAQDLLSQLILQTRTPNSKAKKTEPLSFIVDIYQIDQAGNIVYTPLNSQSMVQPAVFSITFLMAALLALLKL
jgi:GTPase